jgi:hypothetical protein
MNSPPRHCEEPKATKQSSVASKVLDCFAKPVIRPRFARTGLLAMTGVLLLSGGARADDIDQCRHRCERNAASERQVCADLPPNPSCHSVVEKNRLRCLDYCERTYPHAPDRPGMRGNDIKS